MDTNERNMSRQSNIDNATSQQQLSTALSDGILAFSSLVIGCLVISGGGGNAAGVGFMTIAAAASFGVVRFSQTNPGSELVTWHRYASWLAQVLGLPLIAVSYLDDWNSMFANSLVAGSVAVVLLNKRILSPSISEASAEVLGGLATVSLLIRGVVTMNGYCVFGSILIIIAGVVIKTQGELMGWQRVDIFHYMLALSNVALMKGLTANQLPPLYFVPQSS